MISEMILKLLGYELNLNTSVYLVVVVNFFLIHFLLRLDWAKRNKVLAGILILGGFYYLHFGVYKIDLLGGHDRLELGLLNNNILDKSYRSNLYYLFQVKRCASAKDLQFQFKKLSKMLHPDRGRKVNALKAQGIHLKYEGGWSDKTG